MLSPHKGAQYEGDLALALAGYPGSVFTDGPSTFEVLPTYAKTLPFSVVNQLNGILQYGFYCRKLRVLKSFIYTRCDVDGLYYNGESCLEFVSTDVTNQYLSYLSSFQIMPSLALLYMGHGIEHVVDGYISGFNSMEARALLPLITIIESIISNGFIGGEIISFLTLKYLEVGDVILKRSLYLLLKHAQIPFNMRLGALLTEGSFSDPYDEMFIDFKTLGSPSETCPSTLITQLKKTTETTGKGGEAIDKTTQTKSNELASLSLKQHLLVPFVSEDSAKEILYIGSISKVLREFKNKLGKQNDMGDIRRFYPSLTMILRGCPINKSEFELVLQRYSGAVDKFFWKVLLQHKLNEHIKTVVNIYTLIDGSLWRDFIDGSALSFNNEKSSRNSLDYIQAAFEEAVRSTKPNQEDEERLERFNFELMDLENEKGIDISLFMKVKQFGVWNGITIKYKVPQLLASLLSPETMSRWNVIWSFLLCVKRVTMLHTATETIIRSSKSANRPINAPKISLIGPSSFGRSFQQIEHSSICVIHKVLFEIAHFMHKLNSYVYESVVSPITRKLSSDLITLTSLRDARKTIQDAQMLIMAKLYISKKNFLRYIEASLTNVCECCYVIGKGIHLIGIYEDTIKLDPGRPSNDLVDYYSRLQKTSSDFKVSSRVVESMLSASMGSVE